MAWLIEAEYQDGYVHREDDQDHSPYLAGANIFSDILNRRPEAVHGAMVRFSLVGPETRYDIDWTALPANARPIRYLDKERDFHPQLGWLGEARTVKTYFGYQYTDANGKNVKEIKEVD